METDEAESIVVTSGSPSARTFGIPDIEQITDASFGASRASQSPLEYIFQGRILGHYRVATTAGGTGPGGGTGAGGTLFSFRWTDVSSFAVLERISVGYASSTLSARVVDIDAIIARGFTVSDTNGTAITLPSRVRAFMPQSLIGDLRVTGTGGTIITAGTRTLDAVAFAATCFNIDTSVSVNSTGNVDLYRLDTFGQHPIVFTQNEGFVVRTITALPTSVRFYYTLDWAEVAGY